MKWVLTVALALATLAAAARAGDVELLNASFDPTRELYAAYDAAFARHWKQTAGDDVVIKMSHAGSGKQARAVIDGLEADVVTLALSWDVEAIAKKGLISAGWEKRLPGNSAPYTSVIVFLVRKGNPKGIHDWEDVARGEVEVITADPKSSGGARWSYLAAWGAAVARYGGDESRAKEFLRRMYANVVVYPAGARGATTAFAQQKLGDVLVSWENDALATAEITHGLYEVVYPSTTILAEPSVAVVDRNVDRRGTRPVAEAYLKWLYSPDGQEILAEHFWRPRDEAVRAKWASRFKDVRTFTVADLGGWDAAMKKHFGEAGVLAEVRKRK